MFSLALDRVPNFNDETMVFLKKSSLNQFLIFFFNRFASNVLKLVLIYANVVHYCQNFKHTIIIIKKHFLNKPTHQFSCVFSRFILRYFLKELDFLILLFFVFIGICFFLCD